MISQFSFKSVFSFSQSEVSQLFSDSKLLLRIPGLTVLAAPLGDKALCGKVLVITSRKSGKAVQRNKVRRRLRALFWGGHWFERGYSFVIITYRQVHQLSYKELEAIFKKLIKNVEIRFLAA